MFSEHSAELNAATFAKEIVVARMSTTNITISEDGGKNVAEFYEAIYRGISKTLSTNVKDE